MRYIYGEFVKVWLVSKVREDVEVILIVFPRPSKKDVNDTDIAIR